MELRLSQLEVARILRVTESTVNNWETGRCQPTLRVIPKIIEFIVYRVDMESSESLGGKIGRYRKINGLSLKALAGRLGVDIDTVRGWERNEHNPKEELRKRLSSFFDAIGAFSKRERSSPSQER